MGFFCKIYNKGKTRCTLIRFLLEWDTHPGTVHFPLVYENYKVKHCVLASCGDARILVHVSY